ncbi:Peptidylprolyl isomerase [Aphelenchoides besseyi]|nr:Peptidylprolyl isomerase [Aphelenchoides besseyi]
MDGSAALGRKSEESIPVIEIRGEGNPMSPAQIRARKFYNVRTIFMRTQLVVNAKIVSVEEASNGGPLDIKVEKVWAPVKCPREAKRLDFVTFHYKGFLEDGKKFDQTYGRGPIKIQLGTGMVIPGLDKGLRGMCDQELRKINVPYRLSRKKQKHIPNDEHWLRFDIEMLTVEEWTIRNQFTYMDMNNDTLAKLVGKTKKKDFGKTWRNEDIDNVLAVRYYIKYFDVNRDGKIDYTEFEKVMQRDLDEMENAKHSGAVESKQSKKQRGRDPGVAWILDFNNDGVVSFDEQDSADHVLQEAPRIFTAFRKRRVVIKIKFQTDTGASQKIEYKRFVNFSSRNL